MKELLGDLNDKKNKIFIFIKTVFMFLMFFFATILLAIIILFSYILFLSYYHTYSVPSKIPMAETAIVLGASVFGDTMSPVLYERAEAVALLYNSKRIKNILITGDGRGPYYDEITPVKNYLIQQGVSPQNILIDRYGLDTYTSIYRAYYLYNISSAIIVTQHFHLGRSLLIARSFNMNARGFIASGKRWPSRSHIREIPAIFKAVFDIFSNRTIGEYNRY